MGKIILSCGHELKDGDKEYHITYTETCCDAVTGFYDAVIDSTECKKCARKHITWNSRLISINVL